MKCTRVIRWACFAVALGAASTLVNLPALGQEEHEPKHQPATQPTAGGKNLERTMEHMGSSFKKLKKQIPDKEQTVAALETIKSMQSDTITAKSIIPGSVNKLPADQQAEGKKDYLKMLSHTLELECTIEQSLLDGDLTAAQKSFDEMNDLMKEGHKEFKVKKDDD